MDGYIWIDVGNFVDKHNDLKMRKERSIEYLIDAFDAWSTSPSTFKENVELELRSSANSYMEHYVNYVERIARLDPTAFLTANENSMMIESLLRYHDKLPAPIRMQRIQTFFQSDYFANVPEARIGSELFALLRHRLRQGAYAIVSVKEHIRTRERIGSALAGCFMTYVSSRRMHLTVTRWWWTT